MKTPVSVQVPLDAQLKIELEALLQEGETVSDFVDASVRDAVASRRAQAEFYARGEEAREAYAKSGEGVTGEQMVEELRDMLKAKRKQLQVQASSAK